MSLWEIKGNSYLFKLVSQPNSLLLKSERSEMRCKHHDHVTLLGRIGLNKTQNKLQVSFPYFAISFSV